MWHVNPIFYRRVNIYKGSVLLLVPKAKKASGYD